MYRFEFDQRLKISIPDLTKDWSCYEKTMQEKILAEWEEIRGNIPDRVFALEQEINRKQSLLNEEEDFQKSCELNSEISELASIINDLWLWFRAQEEISSMSHH